MKYLNNFTNYEISRKIYLFFDNLIAILLYTKK